LKIFPPRFSPYRQDGNAFPSVVKKPFKLVQIPLTRGVDRNPEIGQEGKSTYLSNDPTDDLELSEGWQSNLGGNVNPVGLCIAIFKEKWTPCCWDG
jgi:hypothetical protein